jgi:parallel beta-helix repeat protein
VLDATGTFRKNRIRRGEKLGVMIFGDAEPLFEDNEISDSALSRAGANVTVRDGANPVFRGNKIHGGPIGVICYDQGRGVIEGNEIASCSQKGIFVKRDSAPIVRGNRIHGSKEYGILVEFGGGLFEDNEVFKNHGPGMRVDSVDAVIRGNRIHDNNDGGIFLQPGTRCVFEQNQVINNKKWGIMVTGGANPTLRGNRVQGSPLGIVACQSARGTYIENDVRGNTQVGLLLDPRSAPVQCEGNIMDPVKPGTKVQHGPGRKKGRGR